MPQVLSLEGKHMAFITSTERIIHKCGSFNDSWGMEYVCAFDVNFPQEDLQQIFRERYSPRSLVECVSGLLIEIFSLQLQKSVSRNYGKAMLSLGLVK
jgi:hypothetical protein